MEKSYDLSKLIAMSSGNMAFVEKMVKTFLAIAPPGITDMNEALASGDYPKLKAAAHKLKPSLDFMGIGDLNDAIRNLEHNAANQTNLDQIPSQLQHITEVCLKACEEMKLEFPN